MDFYTQLLMDYQDPTIPDRFHQTDVLDDYRELDEMDDCYQNGCSGGKGCIWYDYHEKYPARYLG
jgi:hypothetical protein